MIDHLPALATVIGTAVLVWAEFAENKPVKVISKTAAAWGFIVWALILGAWDAGVGGRWIVVGLVLSMVGDLCLLSREKRFFLGGLVAFLLAHVAYVIAFAAIGLSAIGLVVALVPLGYFATRVWQWLGPHVAELGPAVLAYIAVITVMVAASLGSLVHEPSAVRLGLVAAAVLFFLSDLCVARDRFVAPGPDNRLVGLPLYFGAQLVFAWFGAQLT